MRWIVLAAITGCTPARDAPITLDPVDASPVDGAAAVTAPIDSAPPSSFPVTEQSAQTHIASSSVLNPPTGVDPHNRLRLIESPHAGCAATDPGCGWKFEYGNDPFVTTPQPAITNVKGTCFVHAHTGAGTCTPIGKKPIPIGTALRE